MTDTQISNFVDYNTKSMIFSDLKEFSFKNPAGQDMKYHRINIATKNQDGTVGDLVFAMGKAYSFGISCSSGGDDKAKDNDKKGHSLPLCLTDKDGPTSSQESFIDTLKNVIKRSKQHLLDNAENLEETLQVELNEQILEGGGISNCIFVKKDLRLAVKKGNMDIKNVSPMIYPKLIENKKGVISSNFFDSRTSEPIDPKTLLNTPFTAETTAIKVESIYIGGNKYTIQLKVLECSVTPQGGSTKRLLPRPNADTTIKMGSMNLADSDDVPMKPMRPPVVEDEEIEEKKPASPPKRSTGVTKPAKKK